VYVAWALTTLFLRSSGNFNTDAACRTGVFGQTLTVVGVARSTATRLDADQTWSKLLQLSVFRLGLLQDGNVGVRVFPEGEEILVGSFGFGGVAGEDVGTGQANMR
jgi:hypothetical protein